MRKELNPSCTGLLDFLWPSAPKVKLFAQRSVELDVRVSPHPARAFTNAPCGARSLLSVALARGSVDDSWHASTPSCQPCQNRLDCARSDGGFGSLPLLSAAVDRKPCIVPVVPSISTRSDCDLRAFGSVANPSVLPGTAPTSDRRG